MGRPWILLALLWSLISPAISAAEPMLIVLSTGQSLSVGATHWPDRAVYSETPPPNSFALDFGRDSVAGRGWALGAVDTEAFQGLRPLREYDTETPGTAMITALRARLGDNAPAFLHIHMGAGGVSVLQLRSGAGTLHPDWASARARTADGDVMVVQERPAEDPKPFSYAIRDQGQVAMRRALKAPPRLYDTLTAQLQLAVNAARAAGYTPLPHLLVAITHGQSDVHLDHPRHGYGDQMGRYLDQIAATAEDIWGQPVRLSAVLSQTRGYTPGVPLDQLALSTTRADLELGISESQYAARFPSGIGRDYTHLSPRGYRQMGAELGLRLGRMLSGDPVMPLRVRDAEWLDDTRLQLRLSGLRGHLVADPDLFPSENRIRPPANLGFGVEGGNRVRLLSARITGPDTLTLTFSERPSHSARLYLGRTREDLSLPAGSVKKLNRYHATSLRDSIPLGEGPEGPLWNTPPLQHIDWPG